MLWFGTGRYLDDLEEGKGVIRYDGAQFILYSTEDGLVNNTVLSIAEDVEGDLWFGTVGGVSRYDGVEFVTFTTEDGLANNLVTSIVEDREGDLWFGTYGGGVSRYDGVEFVTFTTEDGLADNLVTSIAEDGKGDLWFGTPEGVSRYDGVEFVTFTAEDGLANNLVTSIVEDREGDLWFGTLEGVSRYDGVEFVTSTTADGLAHNMVMSIAEDGEGDLWFGTYGGGVSRYDGVEFVTFTTEDGLGNNLVMTSLVDREGGLWFGVMAGGLSHYDERSIVSFTTANGLANNAVFSMAEDGKGHLWFGTLGGGVSRYDGVKFVTFTTENGLGDNMVLSITEDGERNLWFGTPEGVSRYDGVEFVTFTTEDGLAHNRVMSITEDGERNLWFGTPEGVSRYDGVEFVTFTNEDGLAHSSVWPITEDGEGYLWFGTMGGGVSRYDGVEFISFTTEDGLIHNDIRSIMVDREGHLWFGAWGGGVSRYDGSEFVTFSPVQGRVSSIVENGKGHLWFGTWGGGVSRYDGSVLQRISKSDGLAHNAVQEIIQARNGDIWIATEGGITRYRSGITPPSVSITGITADRRYGEVSQVDVSSLQDYLLFEFQGASMQTRPERMVYMYRLRGYDETWQQTGTGKVEYTDLPVGEYVFEVKAVDRDLNYSPTVATVRVKIHLPYARLALMGTLGLALIGLVVVSGYALRRRGDQRRAEQALMLEMEEELQTAHTMQMGLMPSGPPQVAGFDIGGRCLPANHVGGDFFQYFPQGDRLVISLADITGHAMEAAIPAVMFDGILKTEMRGAPPLGKLFENLNQTLSELLDSRTFVCFTMGELDTHSRIFKLANSGCPYAYHYRAAPGDIVELQVDAYPLGVHVETAFPVIEVQLESGDRIAFCSDGIVEAANSEEGIFGFERTAEIVRQGCADDLAAEALIDRLIGAVADFTGAAPQGDDMTVVVLKVET